MHIASGITVVAIGDWRPQQPMISLPLNSSKLKMIFILHSMMLNPRQKSRVRRQTTLKWIRRVTMLWVCGTCINIPLRCRVYLAGECERRSRNKEPTIIARELIHSVAGSRRFVCFDVADFMQWNEKKKKKLNMINWTDLNGDIGLSWACSFLSAAKQITFIVEMNWEKRWPLIAVWMHFVFFRLFTRHSPRCVCVCVPVILMLLFSLIGTRLCHAF